MLEPQEQGELRQLLRSPELGPIRNALMTVFAMESLRAKDNAISELSSPEPNLLTAARYAQESETYSSIFVDLEHAAFRGVYIPVEEESE